MSKITSVKVTKSGNIAARPEEDGPSAMDLCQDKWEHLREDVKGKLWSQCPPEMVGDFMRAMASYFVRNFHEDAAMKALQYVCSSVFKDPNHTGFDLSTSYAGSPARAVLSVTPQPEDKFDHEMTQEPTVTFDIATSATTDDGVRAALGQWAEEDTPQTRIVFDPLAALPNSDIVALVKQIENKVGQDDLLVMATFALTILLWKQCEQSNAQTNELTIRGLSEGNHSIRTGEKLVAHMTVWQLDNTLETQTPEEHNTYAVTSKIKI